MARARQSWLLSDDPEKFGDAVIACQSAAPWECFEDGKCFRGGDCFTTDRHAASVAWQMIRRLHSDNAVVQRHLDRAVHFLRYGDAHPTSKEKEDG
jgi:hypothetical protein